MDPVSIIRTKITFMKFLTGNIDIPQSIKNTGHNRHKLYQLNSITFKLSRVKRNPKKIKNMPQNMFLNFMLLFFI